MKKLFVGLVVAALFSPLSFAGEVKKKDSFAGTNIALKDFAMAIASTEKGKNTCYNQGDIGIDKNGLILSCQSGAWRQIWQDEVSYGAQDTNLKLPSGLTMIFGRRYLSGYTGVSGQRVNFEHPFRARCLSVIVSADAENTGRPDVADTAGCNASGFTGWASSTDGTSNSGFINFIAIGN